MELCGDGLDNDCNGGVDDGQQYFDEDDDTVTLIIFGSRVIQVTDGRIQPDCDDDPTINPDGIGITHGIDQDCDGADRLHPYMGTEQYKLLRSIDTRPIDCIMT